MDSIMEPPSIFKRWNTASTPLAGTQTPRGFSSSRIILGRCSSKFYFNFSLKHVNMSIALLPTELICKVRNYLDPLDLYSLKLSSYALDQKLLNAFGDYYC